MTITTPHCTTGPEHVVITPTTSLQLFMEMDLYLNHGQDCHSTLATNSKATPSAEEKGQQAIIICGFPAIGKSTFKAANEDGYKGYCVEDLDSSSFSKGPEWPQNYLETVKAKLGERCILTISTHRDVFKSLIEDGVDLVLVYPKQELKVEWLERIRKRDIEVENGAQAEIYNKVDKHWNHWIREYQQQGGCLNYEMSAGENLVGAIDNIMGDFELEFGDTRDLQISY